MLEKIHGIPQRIAGLRAKLDAREGKTEYKENCAAIRLEIARLEALTQKPVTLASEGEIDGAEYMG